MSEDGEEIISTRSKFNIAKIGSQAHLFKNSINNCIKRIGKNGKFMPTRACKLTYYLEDSLNTSTPIVLVCEFSQNRDIKHQV